MFVKSNRYNHEKNALNEILEILKRKQSSYQVTLKSVTFWKSNTFPLLSNWIGLY